MAEEKKNKKQKKQKKDDKKTKAFYDWATTGTAVNRVTETTVRQFEKIFMYGVNELRTDT